MVKNIFRKIIKEVRFAIPMILVCAFILVQVARAYVRYGPAAQLNAGDIKSSHILDGTIVAADISGSASTTWNNALFGNLYATSSVSLPAGSITSAMILNGDIVNADISGSASTTWNNALFGNLYATSSVSLPANSITDTMVADTITASNYLSLSSWFATTTMTQMSSVGIGTSSPFTSLGVAGTITANNINATSTTATSTFSGGVKFNKSGTGVEFQDGSIQTTAFSATSPLTKVLIQTTPVIALNTTAETSIASTTITGGTLGTTSGVKYRINFDQCSVGASDVITLNVYYGGVKMASSTVTNSLGFSYTCGNGSVEGSLLANGATNSQLYSVLLNGLDNYAKNPSGINSTFLLRIGESGQTTSAVDSASNQTLNIALKSNGGGSYIRVTNAIFEKLQ